MPTNGSVVTHKECRERMRRVWRFMLGVILACVIFTAGMVAGAWLVGRCGG